MNVFDLAAVLTLDKSDYDAGLNEAESNAEGFGSKLGKGLGNVAKVGTAALATVGAATVSFTKDILDASSEVGSLGDHIDKQSQKIGISAQAYQEWDFILTHCGASVDGLQATMKIMSTQAQKGSEDFQKLGISQKELAELSTEELFARVVEGLQGMEAGTERTALATKLLGRGATELAPLLNQSAEDVSNMRQQAHDLNKVLSDEAVKAGASYEDSLYNMQTAMSGMKNKMTAELLPGLVSIMDGMAGIFSGDNGAVSKVAEGIEMFIDKITENLPKIAEIATTIITTLVDGISRSLPQIVEAAKTMIKTLVQSIGNVLPLLADAAVEIITALVDALIDALPQLIDGLVQLVLKIVEKLPTIITAIVRAIPRVIKMVIESLMKNLPLIIQGLVELVLAIVTELPTIILELINSIPEIISMIISGFLNAIPQLVQGAIQLVAGIVTHLPEIIAGLIAAIPSIISSILTSFLPFGDGITSLFSGFFGEDGVLGAVGSVLGGEGGLFDVVSGVLGTVGDMMSSTFDWFGTLIDDPAQAIKDAFTGIKDFAIETFQSVKDIVDGIFDLVDSYFEGIKAKERTARTEAAKEAKEAEGWHFINTGNSTLIMKEGSEEYENYKKNAAQKMQSDERFQKRMSGEMFNEVGILENGKATGTVDRETLKTETTVKYEGEILVKGETPEGVTETMHMVGRDLRRSND